MKIKNNIVVIFDGKFLGEPNQLVETYALAWKFSTIHQARNCAWYLFGTKADLKEMDIIENYGEATKKVLRHYKRNEWF